MKVKSFNASLVDSESEILYIVTHGRGQPYGQSADWTGF